MSEVKRKVGRPRKVVEEPNVNEPQNPDCEPATKGYVKCIARKVRRNSADISSAYMTSACLWGIVGICAFSISVLVAPQSTLTLAVVTLLMIFRDAGMVFFTTELPPSFDFLKKYTPPTCKNKKDCDD